MEATIKSDNFTNNMQYTRLYKAPLRVYTEYTARGDVLRDEHSTRFCLVLY